MNKKITVYYAKDADEAARIQAVLRPTGSRRRRKAWESMFIMIFTVETALTEERSRWRKRRKHRPGPPSMPGALEKKLRKIQKSFLENPLAVAVHSRHHPSVSEINQTIENGCTRITFRIQ